MKNDAAEGNRQALAALIDFATETGITELVWEKGSRRLAFRRNSVVTAAPPASDSPEAAMAAGEELPAPAPTHMIKSPMVGTFSRAASKDRPPLVLEGSEIRPGQKLGVVEAMQVPKDVLSDVAGRIIRVFVDNGRAVEYGQPLFEIEPLGEN